MSGERKGRRVGPGRGHEVPTRPTDLSRGLHLEEEMGQGSEEVWRPKTRSVLMINNRYKEVNLLKVREPPFSDNDGGSENKFRSEFCF